MRNVNLRRRLSFLGTVVIFACVAEPSALCQEKSLFAGTWKANLAKSQRHQNHQFQSATMRLEISDDAVVLTFTGVSMAGKEESGTRKLHPDGKEYPVAGAPGVIEVTKWVSPRILETVAKKEGKVVGQSRYEVSKDGQTLTAKVKGIDAKGREFEQVIIFDREQFGGLFPHPSRLAGLTTG